MSASPCIGTRKDLLDFNESQRAKQTMDEYLAALERHWEGKTLASIAAAAGEAYDLWKRAGKPGTSSEASARSSKLALAHIQTGNSIVIERRAPGGLS